MGNAKQLTQDQKKRFRAIGHQLKPIVTVAGNGLTEGVIAEVDRALEDHELIKVKVSVGDRQIRAQAIEELCQQTKATMVQTIGNMALLLRRAKQPNAKLSNLQRFKDK